MADKTFHEALKDLVKSYQDQGVAWSELFHALTSRASKVAQSPPAQEAAPVADLEPDQSV